MEDLSGRIGQAFDRGVLAYHDDPAGFVQNCFRWPVNRKTGKSGKPTDYQLDVMMALVEHGKVAVRGPRGLGKTTEAAWVILWFALTRDAAREDWKVVVTAGAWGQLINFLWPEVERKWTPRLNWEKIGRQQFGPLEMMRRELRLSFGAVTMGAPTDSAKIEGAHADELLYVFDEAKIIPEETWQSAEGAFSGAGEETEANAYALASSTPGAPQGHFYDIHAGAPGLESWHPVHVTIEQVVAAKRIGNQWIKDQEEYFGRESSFFQNHVLGEFALQQEDAVIRQDHLEEAHDRWRALGLPNPSRTDLQVPIHDSLPPLDTIGADIASTGSDRTVFALRHANIISALLWRPHQPDTMVTTGELKMLAETPERPARIVIDALNMGGPVADRLREQGRNVVDFVASKRSDLRTRGRQLGFVDARAAMWWNVREMLEPESGCDLALPPDDQLTADLLAPRWEPGSDGRIRVESKKDIKKRLKRSTDAGDSVAQSLFLTRIAPTVAAPLILRRKGGSRLAPLRQRAGRIS